MEALCGDVPPTAEDPLVHDPTFELMPLPPGLDTGSVDGDDTGETHMAKNHADLQAAYYL